MAIRYRPHHFMCTLGFEGKGYSARFIENYAAIVARLRGPNGGALQIQVHYGQDDICKPCPSNLGTACKSEQKIRKLDQAHGAILALEEGTSLSWEEALRRIRTYMTVEKFHQACAGCEWKVYGMCESALRRLQIDGTQIAKTTTLSTSPIKKG